MFGLLSQYSACDRWPVLRYLGAPEEGRHEQYWRKTWSTEREDLQ